ncbi:MAG: PDZ domain-containing protein [Akkermansiaceae bacterium]|jgi:membrane-associated protease RseP (regulator of RpoE activity)|nr:PDZ domain-containing protein [Akkermansiaceae bacterium]MDP4847869.1 PDZ domain-containing protein [Akkermansiaceae bacterium]MDP4898205.1 PDZ domain-containing protein [Akkermansiaceae bacterium]
MMNIPLKMTIACLMAGFSSAHAADIFVNPSGNDANAGTAEAPLGSLAAAKSAAAGFAGKEAVTVHVADGIYYLPETLVFTPGDSGTEEFPVVYQSVSEGGAVLSGGSELKLSWEPHKDGIFKAQTPVGLSIDQLFIDGRMQRMARYPNFDPAKKAEPYQGYAADAVSKERAALWADPAGGYIHALHRGRWGGYHYLINGKNDEGELVFEGGWQNNRKTPMHEEYRMVENIFEELDAENEWYHNAKTNTLYYKPVAGTDINLVKVEVVRLRHLVEFQGSEKQPVKHITLKGFVVRHTARTFMDVKEQLLRSDWAIYRGGAYLLTGTEDIQILDTEFDQVGGNAIFVNNYNRDVLVKGCHIHDAGASGVCFVGDPDAVRDPLFEYGEKNDLSKIDRTVGPKTNNYPSDSAVEDCLIHGIGRVERQPAGVQISMAQGIEIRDTSIYDTARAGINISEGTWGGHLIERVDVFDTVLETHDHGSFNSWGRDRYWRSDHLTATQEAVDEDPQLPYLDAMETTIIRDSRWRCDHGWDIDLDDGSTNYDLYNNLMLAGGLKLREGFRRHAWNNITVNNGFHPHVWFQHSKDQVYSNIFMQSHRAARMGEPYTKETKVDGNFYGAEKASIMGLSAKLGWDENSVFGDPMFVDPANGDFRVKDGSPALEVGFKNFPMDQFGVKKPSLKAIARTPVIPELKGAESKPGKQTKTEPHSSVWMSANLRELSGVEFSAYGVSEESGGVALSNLPAGSTLEKAGLKKDDLIQGVNGKAVKSIAEFFRVLTEDPSEALKLTVVRDQKNIEVTVARTSIVEMDSASSTSDFKKLPVPKASGLTVIASSKTGNEPLSILTDGKLAENFGPVFGNTIHNGSYKMDLGAVKPVTAVTSWSYNMGNSRGAQKLTVYASNSTTDPGWNLKNFIVLGSIDTGAAKAKYTAASVRAIKGQNLGNYRWIVWAVSPVTETGGGENTAFQEFVVETK